MSNKQLTVPDFFDLLAIVVLCMFLAVCVGIENNINNEDCVKQEEIK